MSFFKLKRVMRLDVLVACFYMHARRVVPRFDAEEHQKLSGYALYESLLTYVAHLDLVGCEWPRDWGMTDKSVIAYSSILP